MSGRRPAMLERLPQQYFTALLGRVTAEAAKHGEPLVNFGRGNPEVGPPRHVIEAAQRAAAVVPGTKTALVELCLVLAQRGDTVLLPDPGYPDYFSAVALADATLATF